MKGEDLLERFFRYVEEDQNRCWIWVGYRNLDDYGRIKISRKHVLVHRLAYEMFVGPIPEGLRVLHRCDVPPCCNPEHLFLGTQKDNAADREAKGRGGHDLRRGCRVPHGHPSRYSYWGCRCRECTTAHSARCRQYQLDKRERIK